MSEFEKSQSATVTVNEVIPAWQDRKVRSNYRKRKLLDRAVKVLVVIGLIAVLYPLLDMLYMFAYRGLTLISFKILTETTTGGVGIAGGGIANAIVGSGVLVGLSSAIVVPVGIFSGVYLAEFAGEKNRFAELVRFASDILAGVPSIVLGYVGYFLFVIDFGWGYSALAAALTLSIMMLPYIIRTTELAIRRVPESIREGAIALGSTKSSMINRLTLRFALPGILTGVMLAVSISFSETAPLLYTALFSNFFPSQLIHQPIAYLTYIVYVYSEEPYVSAHNLAYVSSFILVLFVLAVNFFARIVLKRFSKI